MDYSKMKVLVVDDMKVMRKIVSKSLTSIGFENIETAEDGIPAWEMIQAAKSEGSPFELIVSDWNMPGMTGLDLLKNMKKNPDYASTPFLMVTAEGEKENVVKAVQAGVSNFLIKPFTPEQIEQKLSLIFKGK